MSFDKVLGVTLAGGKSARMGFDKAGIELAGRSLIQRGVEELEACCGEVAISVRSEESYPIPSVWQIEDRRPGLGPLAGLEAVLEQDRLGGRSVFLLACDLPYVDREVIAYVLGRAEEMRSASAVVPTVAGRRQPLCGLYRPECRETVRRLVVTEKRAMHDLLGAVETAEVDITSDLPFHRPDLFHNLNNPADLEALRPVRASG